MSRASRRPLKPGGRSTGRRDLSLVGLVTVVVFCAGVFAGAFTTWEEWLEIHVPAVAPNFFGLLMLLSAAAAAFGVLRSRAAKREKILRAESERRFQALVEQVPAISYTWDPTVPTGQAAPVYVSPQLEQVLGYTPQEWASSPMFWIDKLHADDRDRVMAASDKADRTGTTFDEEYRIYTKDGRMVWIHDEAVVVAKTDGGKPARVQGVMYDITQRKEAEILLADAEHRYRTLIETLPVVTYVSDATPAGQDILRYVAPGMEQLTGYAPEECTDSADFWIGLIHPEDRGRIEELSRAVDISGNAFDAEYRIVRKDGEIVWVHDVGVVVERYEDAIVWQGVFQDVSRRRQAEILLGQAEERFRTLVEQLPAITYIEDASSKKIVYISPQVEAMFGYTPQEWMADSERWQKSLHPDDLDKVATPEGSSTGSAGHKREPEDKWSVDYRTLTRDGRSLWVHNEAVPIRGEDGAPMFWQGVIFDVTERKATEDKLRAAEERYRTLVEQLPVAVYMDAVDDLSTALYISPQYERITGYSAHQRMHDPELWVRMLHPEDRKRVLTESARTNQTGDPFDVEYRIIGADGGVVWLHDHAFLATAPDGRRAWQGVLTDITEHKEAEQQLKSTEERFRAIVEHMPSAIYLDVPDSSLRTLYVSPQIEDITGISPADWTSRPEAWLEAIDPADKESVIERYSASIADRRALERRVPDPHPRRANHLGPRRDDIPGFRAGRSSCDARRHLRHHRAQAGRASSARERAA